MASNGNLIIYTFMADENIPVKNAVVTITQPLDDKQILLGVRLTNESGRTTPVRVETPDLEYSLEPQNTTVPFASVDVRVDHPSTYTTITRNVQVFPGVVSLENVRLIPLADNVKADDRREYIDITPQEL